MHPAFSVIFLTTLIGTGQGLLLALFTAQSYALFGLLPIQDSQRFYAQGSLLALIFVGGGLIASFFHLGRPERAWRTATQWRTSWLSREVIVLPLFLATLLLYGTAHHFAWKPVLVTLPSGLPIDASVMIGALSWLLAFVLFVCTGMIYACLRFLREWHTPLTVINYILLGGAAGFTLASAFAAYTAPDLVGFFAGWSVIITLLGLANRLAMLRRNARLKPKSSLQTAIGVKHPNIRQTATGFMGGSFNTREFFHHASLPLLRAVKWFFLMATFVVPVLVLAAGVSAATPLALLAAFVIQYCGLLAERWFFFAQANHPQNLYYQGVARI